MTFGKHMGEELRVIIVPGCLHVYQLARLARAGTCQPQNMAQASP